ncbi:MAG TPA: serine hydrolase [Gemmatimonadales bacterium]|nr:serine hydrolase [Gemmatimonadales bacterium]
MRAVWVGCAALLVLAPQASAQTRLPKDLDAEVNRALKLFQVPGMAIAVVKDGQVLLARGYGVRRMGDSTRVDATTLFQIASNTKAFTTALLAQLVDSGRIAWDDPVTKYLPWFQLSDPWVTREFTIRDLLTHRSGLGLGAGDLLWFHSNYGSAEIVRRLRTVKPVTSFRSAYAYDNVLYLAAGLVIEAVTGQKWSDAVRQRILTPLGMAGTGTDIAMMSSASAATPHSLSGGKLTIVPIDTIDAIIPAGGLISNVTDLAKWMIVRLDSGRIGGAGASTLFSVAQAKEMWSPQTILPIGDAPGVLRGLRPNFAAYGLGWVLHDYRGHKVVTHDGGLAGMTSRTVLVPDERLGIVMLTNAEEPAYAPLEYELLDYYMGASRTDWITAYHTVIARAEAQADSAMRAATAARDTTSRPPLPLARYVGRYTDAMYGDAAVALEGDHLVLRFAHSPPFVGDLSHWQYGTFVAHWRAAHIEDAYVTFTLRPDGSIDHFTMAAVNPLADFSFDYQDLKFEPAASGP